MVNENGEHFVDFYIDCNRVISGCLFRHKAACKATWVSSDHIIENQIGLFQKKSTPHPPTDGILEILAGGGSKMLEVQERGGLNLKKSSAGVTSTDNSCNSNG